MLRNAYGLAQDGKVNRRGMPNLLQLAAFAREFADVIPFTRPPRIVQRILFGPLSVPARLLGYRGSYPEYLARGPSETVPVESLDVAAALADCPPCAEQAHPCRDERREGGAWRTASGGPRAVLRAP
jgi:hypothetical protein